MKKPNITDGEWQLVEGSHEDWRDIHSTGAPVNSGDIICQDVHKRNAKAISVVPEMIEALIEAYYELIELMEQAHWTKDAENEELVEEIRSALTKAGVTINEKAE